MIQLPIAGGVASAPVKLAFTSLSFRIIGNVSNENMIKIKEKIDI
jgi:hypothetical protein